MSGLAPWIARGVGLSIGVALVVGALALAWAASGVLVLMIVAVILRRRPARRRASES
jgi:hypothetical protein